MGEVGGACRGSRRSMHKYTKPMRLFSRGGGGRGREGERGGVIKSYLCCILFHSLTERGHWKGSSCSKRSAKEVSDGSCWYGHIEQREIGSYPWTGCQGNNGIHGELELNTCVSGH